MWIGGSSGHERSLAACAGCYCTERHFPPRASESGLQADTGMCVMFGSLRKEVATANDRRLDAVLALGPRAAAKSRFMRSAAG